MSINSIYTFCDFDRTQSNNHWSGAARRKRGRAAVIGLGPLTLPHTDVTAPSHTDRSSRDEATSETSLKHEGQAVSDGHSGWPYGDRAGI